VAFIHPGVEKERWEELAQNEPALKKAMTTLEFLSQDRKVRELYEMRQKALHDLRSMTEGAKAEGREEGRAEVARNMLVKGMETGLIAELTGLSPQEIEDLKK